MPMWNWGLTMSQLYIKFGERLKAFGDFFLGEGPSASTKEEVMLTQFSLHSLDMRAFCYFWYTIFIFTYEMSIPTYITFSYLISYFNLNIKLIN